MIPGSIIKKNRALFSRRALFYCSTIAVLIYMVIANLTGQSATEDVGYIIVEPGKSKICIDDADLTINGWDSYGDTYFFVPSYVSLSSISYDRSTYKLFLPDGTLLEHPEFGIMQDVLVDTGEECIPYRVGFYKSNNLYTMDIEVGNGDIEAVDRDAYVSASIRMISPEGKISYIDKNAYIKARGNSSWTLTAKKAYEIKLSEASSILGMNETDKLTLLANAIDPTKMCNKMALDTASAIDMDYISESEWVDVYFDGLYWGNYLVCHEPDIAENNVCIDNLQKRNDICSSEAVPFDNGEVRGFVSSSNPKNITGGYLFEVENDTQKGACGLFASNGIYFRVKSPNNATKEEMEYLRDFINSVDDEIKNNQGRYALIDVESFAKRYLIEELFFNQDSQMGSYFFYKERDVDKIYAGPCWDYDRLFIITGPSDYNDSGTILDNDKIYDMPMLDWDRRLLSDIEYSNRVKEIYSEYSNVFYSLLSHRIDMYYGRIRDSVNMDFARWHTTNMDNELHYGNDESPDENVARMKESLNSRLCFLTKKFSMKGENPDLED